MKTKFRNITVSVLVAILTILTASNSQAQQRGQQGPPPLPDDEQIEQMVEDLSKTLSLTDDQEKLVSDKYFAHFDEVKVKVKESKPKREEMEKMKTEFENDVKSVLTEDQQDLYDSYLKKQKKNRPHR